MGMVTMPPIKKGHDEWGWCVYGSQFYPHESTKKDSGTHPTARVRQSTGMIFQVASGKHTKSKLEAMAQSKSWIYPAIKR